MGTGKEKFQLLLILSGLGESAPIKSCPIKRGTTAYNLFCSSISNSGVTKTYIYVLQITISKFHYFYMPILSYMLLLLVRLTD